MNAIDSFLIRYLYVTYTFESRQGATTILFDVCHRVKTEQSPYCGRTYSTSCVRLTNALRIGHSSAYVENYCACTKIFDVLSEQQRMPAYCDELKMN